MRHTFLRHGGLSDSTKRRQPSGLDWKFATDRSMIKSTRPSVRSDSSDEELVGKCIQGNDEAWSILIDKYKNLIFSIPVKYGLCAQDSEEIFQEVCLALLTELPRLRKPQALAAWLIQTTAHRCFHRKRDQKRYVAEELEEGLSSSEPSADNILHEVEREQILRNTLSELPARCGELVHMLFFQEPPIPYEQAAKSLNVATGSVGFIRMRCLERLRRLLEQRGFR